MHVFCDASKDAIGAVAYLQLFGPVSSKPTLSFLLGKGKLAPNGGNTIPRMDRTAVLGIEVADIIKEQLGIPSVCFRYYTDSQIVLGYLTNTTRPHLRHNGHMFPLSRIQLVWLQDQYVLLNFRAVCG